MGFWPFCLAPEIQVPSRISNATGCKQTVDTPEQIISATDKRRFCPRRGSTYQRKQTYFRQTLFFGETSESRKYFCVRKLMCILPRGQTFRVLSQRDLGPVCGPEVKKVTSDSIFSLRKRTVGQTRALISF